MDPWEIELARRELEQKARERYQDFLVRTRLKEYLTKLWKSKWVHVGKNSSGFPDGISKVSCSKIWQRLHSHQEISDAFRVHFRARFAKLPDLTVEEFSGYLADSSCL